MYLQQRNLETGFRLSGIQVYLSGQDRAMSIMLPILQCKMLDRYGRDDEERETKENDGVRSAGISGFERGGFGVWKLKLEFLEVDLETWSMGLGLEGGDYLR